VCMIRVGKMSYGLNKTLRICTVKIEGGLVTNLPKPESKSSSLNSQSFLFKSKSSKNAVT